MKFMMIPLETDALGTIPKSLERELEELEIDERVETIQTKALLKLVWILLRI